MNPTGENPEHRPATIEQVVREAGFSATFDTEAGDCTIIVLG